jgi:hypothetical protein
MNQKEKCSMCVCLTNHRPVGREVNKTHHVCGPLIVYRVVVLFMSFSLSFFLSLARSLSFSYVLLFAAVRNDNLSLSTLPGYFDRQWNQWQNPWVSRLKELNVSLLVLNRGAHYEYDYQLLPGVNSTLRYLQENHPEVSVIWRNTPHGHFSPKEHFFDKPLLAPPNAAYLRSAHPEWYYEEFEHQNRLVYELLQDHFPEVLHLNVFTSAVLRADSHQDPLHWCTIGPVNDWTTFLYNALLAVFT